MQAYCISRLLLVYYCVSLLLGYYKHFTMPVLFDLWSYRYIHYKYIVYDMVYVNSVRFTLLQV